MAEVKTYSDENGTMLAFGYVTTSDPDKGGAKTLGGVVNDEPLRVYLCEGSEFINFVRSEGGHEVGEKIHIDKLRALVTFAKELGIQPYELS